MTDIPLIFNRAHMRFQRVRAQKTLPECGFLIDRTAQDLADRLLDINRTFPLAVQIGARAKTTPLLETGRVDRLVVMDHAYQNDALVLADAEYLPFASNSLDLVISPFDLHTVNDLPGTLIQIRQALKPDGLFLASIAGGETLHELRQSLMDAEIAVCGGASPRIHPFADRIQMGALLQRAGFALPVVDIDTVVVSYPSIFALMRDLRGMGENNALTARSKKPLTRTILAEADRIYREKFSDPDQRIRATFEIITLTGWAPHDSQQTPLRPGSATHNLRDVL